MGPVPGQVHFHPHLPSGVQEHQARRVVTSVLGRSSPSGSCAKPSPGLSCRHGFLGGGAAGTRGSTFGHGPPGEPHRTPCLCQRLPAQKSCSGLTRHDWRVTLGPPAPFTSSASAFGGHPCPATPRDSVCARGKPTHQAPAGLLYPLSTPRRPWSHIALDFVTGLPPLEGKNVVLTIVDRFSRSVHHSSLQSQRQVNKRTAPRYHPGQRVRLSARDSPSKWSARSWHHDLWATSRSTRIVNPATVRFRLPGSMRVHPTVHISRVKPVVESDLSPHAEDPLPV